MITGESGNKLVKHFESLHDGDLSRIGLQPKPCPSGIYTAGWGHAIVDPITKKFIRIDTPNGYERACELYKDLTVEQADALLKKDLTKYENIVKRNIKVELKQYQFDALVAHTMNTGGSETLFDLINTYPSYIKSIKDWWTQHYITGEGKKLSGLIRRRRSEYELFLNGKLNFFEHE